MNRIVSLVAAVVLGGVFAAAAFAKGPSQATIAGPGLDKPIVLRGDSEGDSGPGFRVFVEETGFFPAMFGQQPDPMLPRPPKGDLGPKYVVTYLVPGPPDGQRTDRIRQDLYPQARQGTVTYTRPGQPFFGRERTHGGWYVSSSRALKTSLVALGLPVSPPPAGGGTGLSAGAWAGIAVGSFAALLAAASLLLVRRRPRPFPAS